MPFNRRVLDTTRTRKTVQIEQTDSGNTREEPRATLTLGAYDPFVCCLVATPVLTRSNRSPPSTTTKWEVETMEPVATGSVKESSPVQSELSPEEQRQKRGCVSSRLSEEILD